MTSSATDPFLDIGGAEGMQQFRADIRREGFLAPDCFAAAASVACGGLFSAEAWLEENDRAALASFADPFGQRRTIVQGPLKTQFYELFRSTDNIARLNELEEKTYRQRQAEIALAPNITAEPIRTRTDVRKFAEQVGKQLGFTLVKGKDSKSRCMVLDAATPGYVAVTRVDTGGRSGSISSSNQLEFYFADTDTLAYKFGFPLHTINGGLARYSNSMRYVRLLNANGNLSSHIYEDPDVSDVQKAGIFSEIKIFKMLAERLKIEA